MSAVLHPTTVSTDRLHGDETLFELTPQEEFQLDQECKESAAEWVCESYWWDEQLEGVNAITAELPTCMSRVMSNMEPALNALNKHRHLIDERDMGYVDAITAALANMQKIAMADALACARIEAGLE